MSGLADDSGFDTAAQNNDERAAIKVSRQPASAAGLHCLPDAQLLLLRYDARD